MNAARRNREALWTAAEAAKVTSGDTRKDWRAQGTSIDSRTVAPEDLFIALKGPNHDGHDYVTAALARGAAAAVVDHVPPDASFDDPLLVVEDTLDALYDLARHARARSRGTIIAVTGSVGKTGTKELLGRALQSQGATVVSAGNLNNQIGAPLSLSRLPRAAKYGVFELAMNHPGEIAFLTRLIKPHVALITTVTAAHLEAFESLEAIADAKAEIFDGLEPGGTAVLNQDNAFFFRLAAAARRAGAGRIVGFGETETAAARQIEWTPTQDGARVRAEIGGQTIAYALKLAGRHWALNSVAALAAAEAAGADAGQAAKALETVSALKGRGARHEVACAGGHFLLIDESYNASPAAMAAAIETLGTCAPARNGRRIAVLGDMLELGPDAGLLHAELAPPLEFADIDLVFCAGPLMANLHAALPPEQRGAHAATSADLVPLVLAAVRAGDVVLVKGSLGSRMGPVVDALLQSAGTPDRAAKGG